MSFNWISKNTLSYIIQKIKEKTTPINSLNSTSISSPLSANQGKILDAKKKTVYDTDSAHKSEIAALAQNGELVIVQDEESGGGGGGTSALSRLSDVEIDDNLSNNQILQYNSTDEKWENVTDLVVAGDITDGDGNKLSDIASNVGDVSDLPDPTSNIVDNIVEIHNNMPIPNGLYIGTPRILTFENEYPSDSTYGTDYVATFEFEEATGILGKMAMYLPGQGQGSENHSNPIGENKFQYYRTSKIRSKDGQIHTFTVPQTIYYASFATQITIFMNVELYADRCDIIMSRSAISVTREMIDAIYNPSDYLSFNLEPNYSRDNHVPVPINIKYGIKGYNLPNN